jgi:hypothetical protein
MLAEQVVLEAAGEKLSRSLIKEIEQRKSLHFNIKASAHRALRIACFNNSITMQEFFDEISQLVEIESDFVINLMKDLSERKKNKEIRKLSKTDEESLYNIIEKEISGNDL